MGPESSVQVHRAPDLTDLFKLESYFPCFEFPEFVERAPLIREEVVRQLSGFVGTRAVAKIDLPYSGMRIFIKKDEHEVYTQGFSMQWFIDDVDWPRWREYPYFPDGHQAREFVEFTI